MLRFAKAFLDSGIPLDVLVLNAGIMAVPLGRTEQGHEMHFGVNHLAHFLTQDALMPRLREARSRTGERGRLVACSSIANMLPGAFAVDDLDWRRRETKYEKWSAYAASKAENLLLTDEAARREPDVVANAFHPGIVTTNLVRYILPELTAENRDPEAERLTPNGRALAKLGIRDADEGAKTHVWLSASAEAGMCLESFSWIRGWYTLARRGRNSSQRKIGSWSRDTSPSPSSCSCRRNSSTGAPRRTRGRSGNSPRR